jgi:beta-lactamase class A
VLIAGAWILAAAISAAPEPEPEPSSDLKEAPWGKELDDEIERVKKTFHGAIALYTSDPHRGFRHANNADKPSYLASGVKIAFMVEVFRQVHKGELSLDDEVIYGPEDIRDGAPVVNPKPLGSKFKIRQLLEWMMQSSDNAASDMIAKKVGIENINRGMKEEGFNGFTPLSRLVDVRRSIFREMDVHADDFTALDIRTVRWTPIWDPQIAKFTEMVHRPKGTFKKQDMLDAFERFYETGVNCARLDDIGRIFERLLRGDLVGEAESKEMIKLMSETKTSNHRILGRLPSSLKVAHKTGSQYERICDLGIIYLGDKKPLIFTACLSGGNDRNGAEDTIAKLARKTYDLVVADHQKAAKVTRKSP